MGRVERSAQFRADKYTVAIPEFEYVAERERVDELDPRFAKPFGDLIGNDDLPLEANFPALEPERQEPQIDWKALQADADALIDGAANDAQSLLEDAFARAKSLIAAAHARVTEIEAQAQAAGREQGAAAARADAEAETAPILQTLRELVVSAKRERHEIIEGAEGELLKLAMVIAERVVHTQVSVDQTIVIENIRSALARLVSREVVTLRVNPVDLDTVRQHRDAIAAANDVEHLRIVEDQRVDRGGIVLETDSGTIDAKISTQLREARKALHGDETIALGASIDEDPLQSPAQAS